MPTIVALFLFLCFCNLSTSLEPIFVRQLDREVFLNKSRSLYRFSEENAEKSVSRHLHSVSGSHCSFGHN
jgi:hypothetical protein